MEPLKWSKKHSFTALFILLIFIFNGVGFITFWDGDTESGSRSKSGSPLPWIIETETYEIDGNNIHKIEYNYLNLTLNLFFYLLLSAGIVYRVRTARNYQYLYKMSFYL